MLRKKEKKATVSKKITIREAAETFAVSTRTIRRYIEDGRITAYRLGPKMIRLDPDEVAQQLLSTPVTGGSTE